MTKYVGFEVCEGTLCKKFELLHVEKSYTPVMKSVLIEDECSPTLPSKTEFLSIMRGLLFITYSQSIRERGQELEVRR